MTNEGFVLLFEAIMAKAYEDANNGKTEQLRKEAQNFINNIKNMF